jgi:hypothetical protein
VQKVEETHALQPYPQFDLPFVPAFGSLFSSGGSKSESIIKSVSIKSDNERDFSTCVSGIRAPRSFYFSSLVQSENSL